MNSFTVFLDEGAKIVGRVELPGNMKKTTFTPRKTKKTFKTFTDNNQSASQKDTKGIDDGISTVNSIASKYKSIVVPHTIKDHVVDRFTRDAGKADREYNIDDVVELFKGIEKNTDFFTSLEKISKKGGSDMSRRVQLIDTTRKTYLIVHVTKRGKKYDIVARTLMGKYRMSDINRMKHTERIPTYFTR